MTDDIERVHAGAHRDREPTESADATTSGSRPAPSLPSSTTSGARESADVERRTAVGYGGDNRDPASRCRQRDDVRAVPRARREAGTCCPSRRGGPSSRAGSAEPSRQSTAPAPSASALRMTLPTLPGSCTSTSPRMSDASRCERIGRRPEAASRAIATMPVGDCDGAGGLEHGALSLRVPSAPAARARSSDSATPGPSVSTRSSATRGRQRVSKTGARHRAAPHLRRAGWRAARKRRTSGCWRLVIRGTRHRT